MAFVPPPPDRVDLRLVIYGRDQNLLRTSKAFQTDGYLSIIKATDCNDPPATSAFLQDKVIKAVLLTLKHYTTSQHSNQQGSSFGAGFNSNKKLRFSAPAAAYDRMAIFADLTDPPNVFAVFTHSRDESMKIFGRARTMCAVGTPFYIYEPEKMTGQIQGNISIIPLSRPLIPLHFAIDVQLNIAHFIPPFPVSSPSNNNTHYFIMHNARISLSVFRLCRQECCCGILCDRAIPGQTRNISCGCLDVSKATKSVVAQFSVMIYNIPPSALPTGAEILEIDRFRSFRTTQLFFEHIDDYIRQSDETIEERDGECRTLIDTMVDYVNSDEAGGWTIVGWSKIGEVDDASNPGEKVSSAEAIYHISLLVPTSSTIRNHMDEHFQELLIPTIPVVVLDDEIDNAQPVQDDTA